MGLKLDAGAGNVAVALAFSILVRIDGVETAVDAAGGRPAEPLSVSSFGSMGLKPVPS